MKPTLPPTNAESLLAAESDKRAVREATWQALRDAGAARFPGTRGRIPNFVGAEAAAARLAELEIWTAARALKVNPDSPQRPVRHAALKAGKKLYLPVPKLADAAPVLLLDPAALPPGSLWAASSIKGAFELGVPVGIAEMDRIDLIVTGCVAVTSEGARLGKGGGYSDIEYALLREAGLVGEQTPIATTVHEVQVLPDDAFPMTAHDISLDVVVTDKRVVPCRRAFARPKGLLPEHLTPEKRQAIPALAHARALRSEAIPSQSCDVNSIEKT